ncbi:MAG: type II secretion system protein [Thermoanaerobaculia bacterium]
MNRRGFTLLEVVMTVAIFGLFLMMLVTLTAEMRGQEKRYPINFMKHPQVIAVLSRLRHDVIDAWKTDTYPDQYPPLPTAALYKQSKKTLLINTLVGGGKQTVVWDFSKSGEVHRISYNVGIGTEWVARGLPPDFDADLDAVEVPGRPFGVRFIANDAKGQRAIDQYYQPRTHQ